MSPINQVIERFSGEHRWLSNFWIEEGYPITFVDGANGNLTGASVEHVYQALKLPLALRDNVLECETPNEAKAWVRKHYKMSLTEQRAWNRRRDPVMDSLIRIKFKAGSRLAKLLVETDPFYLIEGNYWHDNYWGKCSCTRCSAQGGRNMLGKALMLRRSILIESAHQSGRRLF